MPADLIAIEAAAACAAFVSVSEPATISVLRRAAVMDLPTARSSHAVPTPRGGGVPVVIGLCVGVLTVPSVMSRFFAGAVVVFAAVGFTDDLLGLSAFRKAVPLVLAALVTGAVLASGLAVSLGLAAAVMIAITIWVTGYVNAFNFMDGVNGIAAAHAAIGGAVFCWLGWRLADNFEIAAGAAVAAGAIAFLPWNAGRARVFLGDAGSYGLGAALALLAAYAIRLGVPPEAALGPLALYLADAGWTLLRRIRAGESWYQPHRTHSYQRLCDVGWSHQRVTAATAAIAVLTSLLGAVSLFHSPLLRVAADLAAVGLLAAYLRLPGLLGRHAEMVGAE